MLGCAGSGSTNHVITPIDCVDVMAHAQQQNMQRFETTTMQPLLHSQQVLSMGQTLQNSTSTLSSGFVHGPDPSKLKIVSGRQPDCILHQHAAQTTVQESLISMCSMHAGSDQA